jgi:UDP-glucose 4-epimerase
VIDKAREVTGREIKVKEAPRRHGDATSLVASSQKARKVLSWRPELDNLGTIIETAWNWHSKHPNGFNA